MGEAAETFYNIEVTPCRLLNEMENLLLTQASTITDRLNPALTVTAPMPQPQERGRMLLVIDGVILAD